MLDLLRDPLWQFGGFVVGFAAIALALLQRRRKQVWWETFNVAHLLFDRLEGTSLDANTTVIFDSQNLRLHEVQVIGIQVANSGNTAILEGDYVRPLTFKFGEEARVLDAEVIYEEPSDIGAALDADIDSVTLCPVVLNAGDVLGLRLLVYRYSQLTFDGRIVGVRQIRRRPLMRRYRRIRRIAFMSWLLLGPFVFFPQFPESLPGIAGGIIVTGMALSVSAVVMWVMAATSSMTLTAPLKAWRG